MIWSKWVLAGAGALALLAACRGPGPSPYEGLLGLIPDTAETRSYVLVQDYALMRELFDIPLPGPGADLAALQEYISAVFATQPGKRAGPQLVHGPWISGYHQYAEVGLDNRRYLGFDLRNVEQSVLAGLPPRRLEVVQGEFSPGATGAALSTCSGQCMPPDSREEYQGVTFYSWGEDHQANLQKVAVPPAFDQLGQGGRIAAQDRYVFRTLGTDDMRSMIDASLNKRPSLADAEDYRLLAQGMSELGAYGVFFTDRTQGLDEAVRVICQSASMSEQDCARVRAQLEERQPMLRRYQAFATGVGKDGKGAYTALVLVHADAEYATANVGLLRRRVLEGESFRLRGMWAEYFDTDAMEVYAKGRVLLAKLRPTEAKQPVWIEWVFQKDPLLLHESAH